ncbi:MAG: hypothetical protein L0Y38_11375 [Methylococcaceae bacterium]|nr:hypothetical protein [Methylococcaceae bacterium]
MKIQVNDDEIKPKAIRNPSIVPENKGKVGCVNAGGALTAIDALRTSAHPTPYFRIAFNRTHRAIRN